MSEKKIESLRNIVVPSTSVADVYIKKIIYEGDPSDPKRPLVMTCGIEKSNQLFKVVTWDFKLLPLIKDAYNNKNICTITFISTEYRNDISHKLQTITVTDEISSHANEKEFDPTSTYNKEAFMRMANERISDPDYMALLELLIFNNDDFFKWPAAKSIHHAFEGGLAKHTYNVAADAINLSLTYCQEFSIDYNLMITGALLHDIGKLKEYTIHGSISTLGHLMSHLVLGVEMINDACDKLGFDKNDIKFIKLKHIIVSHHNKLEFGSPNMPVLPEAYLVAYSDANDASVEAMLEGLSNLNTDEISSPIAALDGGRILKLF